MKCTEWFMNLEEDNVGAVLLGDSANINEGDMVKTTGRVADGSGWRRNVRPRCECAWTANRW